MKKISILALCIFIPLALHCMEEKGWENSCEQQCLWNTMGVVSFSHIAYTYYQLFTGGLTKEVEVPCLGEGETAFVQSLPPHGKEAIIGGFAYTIRRLYGIATDRNINNHRCHGLLFVPCGCEHSYLWNLVCSSPVSAEKKDQ